MKSLDLADRYEPVSYTDEDDEPTVKVHVPDFFPKVIVEEDENHIDTIPAPPPHMEERTYPGVGLLIAVGTGLLFWGSIAYICFH